MRVLIKIMYDGTAYCGWQVQPVQNSVQGSIAAAIKKLTGEDVSVTGSGRTDAGVHALGQTAHFDLVKAFDTSKIAPGLNFYLPPDIRVVRASRCADGFHARFDAKRKTYIYKMYKAAFENPLLANRALRIGDADVALMKKAAELFVGTHDFSAFKSAGSDTKTTVRTVFLCTVVQKRGEIVLSITANGFLYNMVRKIAAVILSAGQGKRALDDVAALLSPQSPQAKDILPACGLYLKSVRY